MSLTPEVIGPIHRSRSGPDNLTVLILSDFAHVEGGGSKVALNEAMLLARNGVRVLLLAAVGPIDPRLKEAAVEVICLDQNKMIDVGKHPSVAFQAIWNRVAYNKTREILSSLDPAWTVVHIHGYVKALSTSPIAMAQGMGFKLLCTLHDFFAACPNGAFFDYVLEAPCHRVALSVDCITCNCDKRRWSHKLFRVVKSTLQHGLGKFPSIVRDYVSLSERSVQILRRYLPADSCFYPVRNAIDITREPQVSVENNSDLVFIGRLEKEKGVTLLAEAAGALGQKLVFVGDGSLRAELEAYPGVTVTGWLEGPALVEWINRARCVVFPSLWYETYGLVVDEAAARGVPVIVSDVTAAAERVEDGVTGWHFRSGDLSSLREKIKLAVESPNIAEIGSAAYTRFWQNSSTEAGHAANLIDIYRAVLSRKPPTNVTAGAQPAS